MRLFLMLILTIPLSFLVNAQNLVPNGGFEQIKGEWPGDYLSTAEAFTEGTGNWFSPNNGTPDIVTESFNPTYLHPNLFWGKLMPRSGNVCVGLIALSHIMPEAVGNQLEDRLEVGKTYEVSFWVGLPAVTRGNNRDTVSLDADFGMFFSQNRLNWNDKYLVAPQINGAGDTLRPGEWTRINGTINPEEGFEFIYIGYFGEKLFHNRKYLFIDDIQVTEIKSRSFSGE